MNDPRLTKLSRVLVSYSLDVKKGEKIWVKVTSSEGLPLAREVVKRIIDAGAFAHLEIQDERTGVYFFDHATQDQLKNKPEVSEFLANWADKSAVIDAQRNTREMSGCDPDKLNQRAKILKPIRDITMKKPWVLTTYPTHALAQDANMSYESYVNFYFSACNRDWVKESARCVKLAKILNSKKEIHVIGKGTDIRLSVAGRAWIADDGKYNMPGGEVFTAPIEDKVNGVVTFDFPLLKQGKVMRDIRLEFKDGVVVQATASENQQLLRKLIATDHGSKFLGELAIGMNAGVKHYMYNMLFDEKIAGTVHMALGEAYEECKGTNKSALHMDIVKDMRGKGSEVWADDTLILQNGKIVCL